MSESPVPFLRKLTLGGTICVAAMTTRPAHAADFFVEGLVPNWDQPHYYPDPLGYDPSGPGAFYAGSPFRAWCAPTCAAMMFAHWQDVRGRVSIADASADGSQALAGAYGGAPWGSGSSWHDYTADGLGAGTHPLRGTRAINDHGWYMDTNDVGDPGLPNFPHTGTFYQDIIPGMLNFMAACSPSPNFQLGMFGTDPAFGAFPVNALLTQIKTEIDENRTVMAHFTHWNIVGPQGPGEGTGFEEDEAQIAYSDYIWGPPVSSGDYGEFFNFLTDGEGLGHAVVVVGYSELGGVVTDLIVHDNTPRTVRNVRVPVAGAPLVLITTLSPIGFNLEVGDLTAGQQGEFQITGAQPNTQTYLAYSLRGLGATFVPPLQVTLDLAQPVQAGSPKRADAGGNVTWRLPIPPNAQGRSVWFQSLQFGQKSNVIKRIVN